jgi:hypothetical protein
LKNGEDNQLIKGRETENSNRSTRREEIFGIIAHAVEWKLRARLKSRPSSAEFGNLCLSILRPASKQRKLFRTLQLRVAQRQFLNEMQYRLPPIVDHVDNMAHDNNMASSSKSDRIFAACPEIRKWAAEARLHQGSVITPNLDKIENSFLSRSMILISPL